MTMLPTQEPLVDPGSNDQREHPSAVASITDTGRNFVILVAAFALHLTAFVVCLALLGLGAGLVVLGVGLFILAAGLVAAGWVAEISRTRLIPAGVMPVTAHYPPITLSLHGWRRRLSDGQSWRDLLLVVVMVPVSTASVSVAISWVAGGLGGVTFGIWRRWLPEGNRGIADLLGSDSAWLDLIAYTVIGVVLLLTLRAILSSLVRLHTAIAFGLLRTENIGT